MKLQDRKLKVGMKGEEVKLLLSHLIDLGYNIPKKELAERRFGKGTRQAVLEFQEKHSLQTTGVVDEPTAQRLTEAVEAQPPQPEPGDQAETFVVRGVVRQANGEPLIGGIVCALDKDMRSEQPLGEVKTDKQGHYQINYSRQQFCRAEKDSADLIVQVLSQQGAPLVESGVLFNARPEETIDLVIGGGEYKGPSEYEQYIAELTPVLQGVPLVDLTEDDIAFLTGETEINQQHIEFIATAAKLKKDLLPPEALYACFRQNLPTNLPALLAQDPEVLRSALEAALRDNIIPLQLENSIEAILERFKELRVEQAFTEPATPGKYSLGALLSTSPLLTQKNLSLKFVTAAVQHKGPGEAFWNELRQDPDFEEEGVIEEAQFTLQLGALTQNHLPLVQALREQLPEGKPESLRDLARLDPEGWLELINEAGTPPDVPGEDETEKAQHYATTLAQWVEDLFPTAVLFNRLEQDQQKQDQQQYDISGKADLLQFYENTNPHFDLGTTDIDQFMAEHGDTVLEGVKDPDRLTRNLKGMQRLDRVSPRHDREKTVFPLLAYGPHSALGIARMGPDAFVRVYGDELGGEARAREIHARARQVSATALTLFTQYGQQFHSIRSVSQYIQNVDDIPNWKTLFGAPDFCECEHCRSVYSPAAYLVDVLQFLKDVAVDPPYESGLDALFYRRLENEARFERRADIGEVELSCENTNTPMPYVDLVNEVFEKAVAPLAFSLDYLTFKAELNDDSDSNPSADLRDKFDTNGFKLSSKARIVVENPDEKWAITDNGWRYVIKINSAELDVSAIPQTYGTADELAANPEHVNPKAYDTLKEAVYPWSLPYDLWTEEARVYLDHLGVHRYQLMEAFHTEAPPLALSDVDLASEYLGLTPFERQIITGGSEVRPVTDVAPLKPWEFWGYRADEVPDPVDWIDDLGQVPVFLEKSGLSFAELLELEQATFVTITVATDDPTCDLANARIDGLTATTLDRIHRFVRLQRKLGWTIRDLDKTITALGVDISTQEQVDDLLRHLAPLERLRAETKVPLVKMLSWWSTIDTTRTSEDEKSLYEQLFLNKAVLRTCKKITWTFAQSSGLGVRG